MSEDLETRGKLRAIYCEMQTCRTPDDFKKQDDFAFHIIECMEDMNGISSMLSEIADSKHAAEKLIGFLYHVVPHLNAAARLLLDKVPDTFSQYSP